VISCPHSQHVKGRTRRIAPHAILIYDHCFWRKTPFGLISKDVPERFQKGVVAAALKGSQVDTYPATGD